MQLSVPTLVSALLLGSFASGMQSYNPDKRDLAPHHADLLEQMLGTCEFTAFAEVQEVRDRIDELNKAKKDLTADLIKARNLYEDGLTPESAWTAATKPEEDHSRYVYCLSMELARYKVDPTGFERIPEVRRRVDELNEHLNVDVKTANFLRESLAADFFKVRYVMEMNDLTDVVVAWNSCM